MGDLTDNFSEREFACRGLDCCGGQALVRGGLEHALQALRDRIGRPITITSGYRCRHHNMRVGGADNSMHLAGMAADIRADGMSPAELAYAAEQIPAFRAGGMGVYSNWVHVDVRRTGRARW